MSNCSSFHEGNQTQRLQMHEYAGLSAFTIKRHTNYTCISHLVTYRKTVILTTFSILQWRHNGCDGVSNHQPQHCLLSRFWCRSKKTPKLRVTGHCAGNSPVTGELPTEMASDAEKASIWWRHHGNMWQKPGSISFWSGGVKCELCIIQPQ